MEEARVVIVGAGPAGLVLGLSLAQHGVKSVILEREREITQDPRGVYLAGDAVRILWSLGLDRQMPVIGHELQTVNFHTSSFVNVPFHTLNIGADILKQGVPTGILQMQPALEKALRDQIVASKLCELRVGCNVQNVQQTESGVEIEYAAPDATSKRLQAAWLVGADGKRGVVRKGFLEKVAGIRQVHADYQYEGTWIAANLKISLPTPESHPEFPAWKAGLSPQDVYDLFWPKGWHFCSPPGKPTACGRFGPHEKRLWRHEFRQDDWNDQTMDAEELFWSHLLPMLSRNSDSSGQPFEKTAEFPRDCIEILRCRPFTFTHKVVNRWYHRKCVLIGDAAHVFPPFGGQGIASGIRDAHQLAWRIALLEKQLPVSEDWTESMLSAWAKERTQSIKDAAYFTKMNGLLCNESRPLLFRMVQLLEFVMQYVLWRKEPYDPQAAAERDGLMRAAGGFFLADHGGGRRLPQIYIDTIHQRSVLSDCMFGPADSPLRLLAIVEGNKGPTLTHGTLEKLLCGNGIPKAVLSPDSVVILSLASCQPESIGYCDAPITRKACVTPRHRLSAKQARPGYDVAAFTERLGKGTQFAIVRPDFFIFAVARDSAELDQCLARLKNMLQSDRPEVSHRRKAKAVL